MAIFIIGATGFIGPRVIRLLAARGEEIVCMDINPGAASFDDLGKQVRMLRGDVTSFDDVMAATVSANRQDPQPGVFFPAASMPHVAMKLNISAWTTASRARSSRRREPWYSPVRSR
jgi:nucleoside-diphosphate-sugar epimerase